MNKTLKYILGALAIVAGLLFLWYFRSIVAYVVVAAVLSIVGRPLVRAIKKIKIKNFAIPDWLAALVALLAIYAVAVTFFSLFIPLIFGKISDLTNVDWAGLLSTFEVPLARFQDFLDEYFSISITSNTISEALSNWIGRYFNPEAINSIVSSIVSIVGSTVVALFSITFITFFFLKDENLFLRILLAITPTKYEGNIKHALNSGTRLLSRYFIGILSESLLMMIMVATALICCGYTASNAFFIGIIVGVLNVIPYVGPWLGFGISFIVSIAFVGDGMTLAFMFFSLGITVLSAQLIDNFVLQPLLYSSSVNAHPLEIFIVILMAGHFGGVLGMIVAIPAYTVLRVIGKEFFTNFKIVRKLTENMDV